MRKILLGLSALLAASASATPPLPPPPPPAPPPRLLIVISVDQLSSDLFDAYRPHFTGGLARLARGAAFRNGYQAHGSAETCPGHSTILTGRHPASTGIIANGWIDQGIARADKQVNCAEDETVAGSTSRSYTVSPAHLKVATLAEFLKRASPASKVVAVAGKDRSAVMTTGRGADQRWYWGSRSFVTDLKGRPEPASVTAANQAVAAMIAAPQPGLLPPPPCAARAKPIQAGDLVVGAGRFERVAGDARAFRASPAFDGATLALAAALLQEQQLGRDSVPDLLTIGLAGTDIIGHAVGTGGQEMCLQLLSLDRDLGDFFQLLDGSGLDYAVALTADHGAMDLPERLREQGVPQAARAEKALEAEEMGKAIGARLGLTGPVLLGETSGDMWIDRGLGTADRSRVLAAAVEAYRNHRQVEAVFMAEEMRRTPIPTGAPDQWTLKERVRASFDLARSGDFIVVLKQFVSPIVRPSSGYVAGHGTPWDHDRRVPILFWRAGMPAVANDRAVATVDILPTLTAMLGLAPPQAIDGRCIDGVTGIVCPR